MAHTSLLRHSFISIAGTGISACFPSTTPFGLALGPDLPRADEPSPGILGLSVCRILTYISLLTPAFSLPCSPPLLTIWLPRACNAPLPLASLQIRSFGANLLVVCASPHPFPLSGNFGTLADDLGCFPFDHGPYHPQSDCRVYYHGIRSLIILSTPGWGHRTFSALPP